MYIRDRELLDERYMFMDYTASRADSLSSRATSTSRRGPPDSDFPEDDDDDEGEEKEEEESKQLSAKAAGKRPMK
jgi:hypothetical protein